MESLMNEENSQPVEVEEVQRGIEVILLADQETVLPDDKGLDIASEAQASEEQIDDENLRVRYCVRCHKENKFPLGVRMVCERCKFIIFYINLRFEDVGWEDDNFPTNNNDDDDDDDNIEDNETGVEDVDGESGDNNDEITAEKVNSENNDENEETEKEGDNVSNEHKSHDENVENDD